MTVSKSNLPNLINEFNNASFLRYSSLPCADRKTAIFCHFVASDFARDGIARTLNISVGEGIYATAPQGTYYIDYNELKRKQYETAS